MKKETNKAAATGKAKRTTALEKRVMKYLSESGGATLGKVREKFGADSDRIDLHDMERRGLVLESCFGFWFTV